MASWLPDVALTCPKSPPCPFHDESVDMKRFVNSVLAVAALALGSGSASAAAITAIDFQTGLAGVGGTINIGENISGTGIFIDTVTIEVDHVIWLTGAAGTVEFFAQCRQRWWAEHVKAHQPAQFFHRLDQWQGAGTVIDVTALLVFRPRSDEQNANGCRDHGHLE